MNKLVLLWRRLFHRHDPPKRNFSPGITAYLSTNWRWVDAIERDFADDPMMCDPDIRAKKTAHITRIIETATRPLPVVDDEAPTQAVPGWHFYVEDTVRMEIDEYATRPMSLAEINAIVPGIPVLR